MKQMLMVLSIIMWFMIPVSGCAGEKSSNKENADVTAEGHITVENTVRDVINHPAFEGFGELLLPRDDNSAYYGTRLTNVASLMPYHGNVRPAIVVNALNHLIDEVNGGKTIFYDVYSEQQKQQDAAKRNTGLFFFRGQTGSPFAVVCPGGGFSYVGSLHEGFPLAQEISRQGLNAFVLRYRIGSEQKATEDLAAAISFIFTNAAELGISVNDYSVWGASAGARMAGNIALNGVFRYVGGNIPKPSTAIIAYTGQSSYSNDFSPAFFVQSENDGIAPVSVVDRRVENLRNAGVEVEYRKYRTAGHGFGLGVGTDAEGWINYAIQFWKKYIKE
jgi:acetyl esterase/lipase